MDVAAILFDVADAGLVAEVVNNIVIKLGNDRPSLLPEVDFFCLCKR